MNLFTRLTTLAVGLVAVASAAWADVPFKTSTVENGEFGSGTIWYTMQIGNNGYVISNNGTANYISLTKTTSELDDADLWCFVGDDTNGYKVYNKEAGAGKVLASPTTMTGTEGGTAYVVLKDADNLGNYTDTWLFSASTDLGDDVNGQYMYQKGTPANKINDRERILAFWTGGQDHGSTLKIEFAETEIDVTFSAGTATKTNGTVVSSSSGGFYHYWKSTATDPQITINAGYNNMSVSGDNITAYVGTNTTSQDYTITTSSTTDYVVYGYSFDFKMASTTAITVSGGGQTLTATSSDQNITVTGLEEPSASFTLSGGNYGVELSNFTITVRAALTEPEPQTDLMISTGLPNYRIPAIAKAYNGDLIAVADYRYNGSDIGGGKLDLRYRISHDNGANWDEIKTLVAGDDYAVGSSKATKFMHVGFGDPCIVADRESPRVLIMSCTGDVMFPSGTRADHQGIARFYSTDNGATWSEPEDISESIYTQFDNSAIGTPNSMFIGSGRVFQSSTVKVNDYYRLYCSVLYKDVSGTNKNYVLYSDDFGENWSVLGGVDVAPIPSGADEPKTEELPDGSILCSSRMTGGRYYNIFHFTDSEKAEGSWGAMATSNSSTNGVVATGNSCNGEVMVLPVTRVEDKKDMYLILQSVPRGSGRTNVSIYYKALESVEDFTDATALAKDWDGYHQASYMGSAYSTMTLQADSTIGFLYEESTHGYDYTIVYKNYSLEQITDSAFTYNPEVDRATFLVDGIDAKLDAVKDGVGTNVGCYEADGVSAVETLVDEFKADPTMEKYEALTIAIQNLPTVPLTSTLKYRLRNNLYTTYYLTASTSAYNGATLDESNEEQLFTFIAGDNEGEWKIYNEAAGVYVGSTPSMYAYVPVATTEASAALYTLYALTPGLNALLCQSPTVSGLNALHLSQENNLVPWYYAASNEASFWFIEPTDIATDIATVETQTSDEKVSYYDLQGRRLNSAPRQGVYITSDRKKRIAR